MARRWAIVLSVTATIAAIGLPVLASPAQSQESPAFTLDLSAKTQEHRTKIKFFATATAASTLVADGKDIKETTKQLAANEKTEIKAEAHAKVPSPGGAGRPGQDQGHGDRSERRRCHRHGEGEGDGLSGPRAESRLHWPLTDRGPRGMRSTREADVAS